MSWTKTDNNEEMEEIRNMFRQIDEKVTTVDRKIDKNAKEMVCLRQQNEKLKRNIKEQEERLGMIEREIKRNNIIIQGMVDQEREDHVETREKVQEVLRKIGADLVNANTEIVEVRRIGTYETRKKRPILIKLRTRQSKLLILKRTKNLKGKKIYGSRRILRRRCNKKGNN
jgi:chromosome segregation ATPase